MHLTNKEVSSNKLESLLKYSSVATIAIAAVVTFGWIVNYAPVLNIIPGGATMKINTSIGFILIGILGLIIINNPRSPLILRSAASFVAILAVLTLSEYIFGVSLRIDNLLIEDSISTVTKNRMSPATALCFFLVALGTVFFSLKQKIHFRIAQYSWLPVMLIAFVSIVTFILNIPAEEKTQLFGSMAIHTSVLFFLMAQALFFQTKQVGFAKLITGPLPGSKITRQLLPFIVVIPVVLSYLFFYLTINSEFNSPSSIWTIINTISVITLSVVYISILAIDLNKSAVKESQLKIDLESTYKNLNSFKRAISKTSILIELDNDQHITGINDNFSKITGFEEPEVIGKNHYSFLKLDDQLASQISKSLRKQGFWEGEIEREAKDGFKWVYSTIIKNSEKKGTVRYNIIEQDISERKLGEIHKDTQFMIKLEQKNKELEQFLYIASHDLQEPLRSMRSMVELLSYEIDKEKNSSATDFMDLIEESANRMSALVSSLMDHARLGHQREMTSVDLNDILYEVKSDLKESIDNSSAHITHCELPSIDAYPLEIRLLFQNLIGNAIKFRKKGVTPKIDISANDKGAFWEFSVRDNGIGIKNELINKIFLMFQKLSNRNEYEGTGIGLTHCMKIVSLHGGKLWAESVFGEGSCFFFTLPKNQYHEQK